MSRNGRASVPAARIIRRAGCAACAGPPGNIAATISNTAATLVRRGIFFSRTKLFLLRHAGEGSAPRQQERAVVEAIVGAEAGGAGSGRALRLRALLHLRRRAGEPVVADGDALALGLALFGFGRLRRIGRH